MGGLVDAITIISDGTMALMFCRLRKKLFSKLIHCWPLVILVLIMLPSPYTLCMLLLVGRISLHLIIKMFFHRIINIILSPDVTTGWKGPQKRGRGTGQSAPRLALDKNTDTNTCINTHANTDTNTSTNTHANTDTNTYTNTHANTETDTCTNTNIYR